MAIELLKKGSIGLKDTLERVHHHAQPIIPHVTITAAFLNKLHEKGLWRQGNIPHYFVTKDGRTYVLRPLWTKEKGYFGIRLLLRASRGNEIPQADFINILKAGEFLITIKNILTNKKNYSRPPIDEMSS